MVGFKRKKRRLLSASNVRNVGFLWFERHKPSFFVCFKRTYRRFLSITNVQKIDFDMNYELMYEIIQVKLKKRQIFRFFFYDLVFSLLDQPRPWSNLGLSYLQNEAKQRTVVHAEMMGFNVFHLKTINNLGFKSVPIFRLLSVCYQQH